MLKSRLVHVYVEKTPYKKNQITPTSIDCTDTVSPQADLVSYYLCKYCRAALRLLGGYREPADTANTVIYVVHVHVVTEVA